MKTLSDLLPPFLGGLGDDLCVSVAHHSNQHIQQEDWDKNHEEGKDDLCQWCKVGHAEHFILQIQKWLPLAF